jgi:hypothetical protein
MHHRQVEGAWQNLAKCIMLENVCFHMHANLAAPIAAPAAYTTLKGNPSDALLTA